MKLLAIDVAILPPPHVSDLAASLNAGLREPESGGLRLDAGHLPHITLTQQFIALQDVEAVLLAVDLVVRTEPPLPVRVIGGGRSGDTIWISIDRSSALVRLHRRLMEALRRFEKDGGTPAAFADDSTRDRDVKWVAEYRDKASFRFFTPHITLGHAAAAPSIRPFDFEATTVAACQLGRFCTCRRIERQWTLSVPASVC